MTLTRKTQYIAAASLFIVSITDIITPVDYVMDILYLCSILIIFKQDTRTILSFSITACLLIVINVLLIDYAQELDLSVFTNRGISVFAIIITSYIAINYQRTARQSMLKQQQYLKDLEAMLFLTSHHMRKPVANILGLVEIINAELGTEGLSEYGLYLQTSAGELDQFIKELNEFIAQAEQKQNVM